MSQLLFKGVSSYRFFVSLIVRGLILAGAIWLIMIYDRNPPVIGVLIGIAALIFFTHGNDEVLVYPDRLVVGNTSIWSWIRKSKGKTYFLKDVVLCSYYYGGMPGRKGYTPNIIDSIVDTFHWSNDVKRRGVLELKLHTGEIISVSCDLDEYKKDEIIHIVNSIVQQQPATGYTTI